MADTLTIGIDFGTSAVKVVAMDRVGTVHAHASAAYATTRTAADRAEQDPQEWWDGLCAAMRDVLARTGPEAIAAIGLSGQLNGIVLTGEDGKVLCPALIWLDQRCGEETARLAQEHGALLERTASSPISPIAVLPKLQWLARHDEGLMRRAARIFQVKDYVLWRLTGALATDANEASATLLMDLGTRRWSPDMLRLGAVREEQLAPIRPSVAIAGRVSAAAAAETGLKAGTPVVPGAGDTGALAVGCGAYRAGTAAVTLGTAGHVVAAVPNRDPGTFDGLWRMAHVTDDRELWLGLIPAGGLSIEWLRGLAGGFAGNDIGFEELERLAERSHPGAAGAVFLPFLAGAGTPWNDSRRLAGFAGLSTVHGAPDLVRAVYEGVAFNIRACVEAFERAGVELTRIHLAEGGARSSLWCQIIADVLGREVRIVEQGDTSATGAAIMARAAEEGASLDAVVQRCVRIGRVHQPRADARLDAAWERFSLHAGKV